MHPSSTSVTSMIPASLPSHQHVMPSAYNNSSNPVCWNTTPSSTAGGAATAADSVIISNGNTFQHHPPPALQREDVKEVDMKPLDLSLRPPRQQSDNPNNNINSTSSWPRISTPSSSRSGSQRLSPYPVLSQSSGSLSSSPSYRHLGSPNLSQSRSPLARSISPYYPYHRQTPSPYYLSGSCTPPDNCSSLQVLSSTNRLLNALSSVSTSQLRSYDDSSSSPAPSDLMSVCEPTRMMKDPEASNRRHHHHNHHHHHQQQQQQLQQQNNSNREVDIEVESEEPTYIDMDSSTTVVKSVSSSRQVQHHPGNIHGMSSSMYAGTTVMSSSSSTNNLPMSHHQTPLPTSQPHLRHHDNLSSASSSNHPGVAVTTTGRSPPHELQSYHHHHQHLQQRPHPHPHQAADSRDYLQSSVTSRPSFISNDLQMSSSSIPLSSPSPLRSPPSSHTMHLCDSSNQGITTSSRDDSGRSSSSSSSSSSYPFYHNENQGSTAAPTSTLASNPAVDYVRDIRMDHQDNRNQQQHQQQQQQQQHQTPTVVKEMLDSQQQLQQHQNPDSSSSPSAVRDSSSYSASSYSSTPSSSSSSHWRATSTNAELISPGNSNNSTSTISGNSPISSHQRPPSPQMSPDSNISRSALSILQSPSSNKENIRFINCGSTAALSRSSNTSNASTIVNGGGGGGGGAPVSTGSTTARRSFFQIDKSLLEENGGSALLADDAASQNGGDSSRCSVLDFWISKILMEETPRRRCGADIRHTVDGNKRIRLRLVDLIELQVEQSLLKA